MFFKVNFKYNYSTIVLKAVQHKCTRLAIQLYVQQYLLESIIRNVFVIMTSLFRLILRFYPTPWFIDLCGELKTKVSE